MCLLDIPLISRTVSRLKKEDPKADEKEGEDADC